jgi:hypothetical protein
MHRPGQRPTTNRLGCCERVQISRKLGYARHPTLGDGMMPVLPSRFVLSCGNRPPFFRLWQTTNPRVVVTARTPSRGRHNDVSSAPSSSRSTGGGSPIHTTTTRITSSSSTPNEEKTTADADNDGEQLVLHIGPSGDCWTGTTIFAAKHLQPGYVKSIPLMTTDATTTESSSLILDEETIVSLVEEDVALQRLIYDSERIDYAILWENLMERQRRQQQRKDETTTTGVDAASPAPPHSSF